MTPSKKTTSKNFTNRILKKILSNLAKRREGKLITYERNITITPILQGQIVFIYNGMKFKAIRITELMFQHKLGEFSFTRVPHKFKQKHGNRKKK